VLLRRYASPSAFKANHDLETLSYFRNLVAIDCCERDTGLEEQRAECHPHSRRVSAANRPTNWPRIGPAGFEKVGRLIAGVIEPATEFLENT
jgi:hypothetical protein